MMLAIAPLAALTVLCAWSASVGLLPLISLVSPLTATRITQASAQTAPTQLSQTINLKEQIYPESACPVSPTAIAISPDSQTVAVSSANYERACGTNSFNSSLTLWHLQTGEHRATLLQGQITEAFASNREQRQEPDEWANFYWMGEIAWSIAFTPNREIVAAGLSDKTVRLWNAQTGAPIRTLRGHEYAVHAIAISPDGQQLASGSSDQTVNLWNLQTGERLRTLNLAPIRDTVYTLAFSSDSQQLVSTTYDGKIQLWAVRTGQLIRTLANGGKFDGWRVPAAFSPTEIQVGERAVPILATADADHSIKLWNARTGARIITLRGHEQQVTALAFSPDGEQLASNSLDGTVKFWDLRSLQLRRSLSINPNTASYQPPFGNRLVFSPDGQTIAVDALFFNPTVLNYGIKLLDVSTEEVVLAVPEFHATAPFRFTPDGQRFIAVAGAEIRIWQR